ncbi:hypothetical protein CANCADRAFT_19502, partial [Tortispora caseinolytica NRRL Y-17796]
MKELSKEYGWVATGVYLGISMIDLPLTFFVVHSAGQETVSKWEDQIKSYFGLGSKNNESTTVQTDEQTHSSSDYDSSSDIYSHIPEQRSQPSLWTEFLIAYGIHKSLLIFLRVPLTFTLTPYVAKTLRGWGYKIGQDGMRSTITNAAKDAAK